MKKEKLEIIKIDLKFFLAIISISSELCKKKKWKIPHTRIKTLQNSQLIYSFFHVYSVCIYFVLFFNEYRKLDFRENMYMYVCFIFIFIKPLH